jgi:cobalamin biosynthesis protein CobD/CbiB
MMIQIILGLWRFLAPYTDLAVQPTLWMIHPLLGIGIAVSALALFRSRRSADATRLWTAARYVALAPLAFGLSMRYGVIAGWPAVVAHMVLGLTALGVIDSVIKNEGRRQSKATDLEAAAQHAPTA